MTNNPFTVMEIPQRKKPSLFVRTGETEHLLIATFRNEECAEIFIKELKTYINDIYDWGITDE